jgi:hypothetical protein
MGQTDGREDAPAAREHRRGEQQQKAVQPGQQREGQVDGVSALEEGTPIPVVLVRWPGRVARVTLATFHAVVAVNPKP